MPNRSHLAVVLLSLAACRTHAVAPPQHTAVKIAAVERGAGTSSMRYSAHIEPATRVDRAFKVGGYVESIAMVVGVDGERRILQQGDHVRAGQELAALRKTDYVQKLAEAQAALAQARAAAAQARLDLRRDEQLAEQDNVAAAQLDAARTQVATADATVAGAKARVDEAMTARADTSLRAPLDGVILERRIEVGALASPGTVAFSIADVADVKAVFAVPDTVLPRVQLGAEQSITTEAFPEVRFAGTITRISPTADPRSRVFEAEITIANADGRLKPGMVAALELAGTEPVATAPEPLVPLSAIVRSPAHPEAFAVFVVDDTDGTPVAHVREVELGAYLGRVIPVRAGLREGERIVVQGAGLLSDGETVEVVR